jgi:hypothetical protein
MCVLVDGKGAIFNDSGAEYLKAQGFLLVGRAGIHSKLWINSRADQIAKFKAEQHHCLASDSATKDSISQRISAFERAGVITPPRRPAAQTARLQSTRKATMQGHIATLGADGYMKLDPALTHFTLDLVRV